MKNQLVIGCDGCLEVLQVALIRFEERGGVPVILGCKGCGRELRVCGPGDAELPTPLSTSAEAAPKPTGYRDHAEAAAYYLKLAREQSGMGNTGSAVAYIIDHLAHIECLGRAP